MSSYSIGDTYTVLIAYDDNPLKVKRRQVLIVDIEDDQPVVITIAEITRTAPKNPPGYYDQFKVSIDHWAKAGLHNRSYVKTHKVYKISSRSLKTYVGRMDSTDLANVINQINNNYSGNDE